MSGGVFGRGDPAEGLPRVSPYFGSTNSGRTASEFRRGFLKKRRVSSGVKVVAACAVCLDDVADAAALDGCAHLFCRECITQWAQVTNRCPQCRTAFSQIRPPADSVAEWVAIHVEERQQAADAGEDNGVADYIDRDFTCQVCGEDEHEEVLLLCDGCDSACHTYCIGLAAVPEGDFYCSRCSHNNNAARRATAPDLFVSSPVDLTEEVRSDRHEEVDLTGDTPSHSDRTMAQGRWRIRRRRVGDVARAGPSDRPSSRSAAFQSIRSIDPPAVQLRRLRRHPGHHSPRHAAPSSDAGASGPSSSDSDVMVLSVSTDGLPALQQNDEDDDNDNEGLDFRQKRLLAHSLAGNYITDFINLADLTPSPQVRSTAAAVHRRLRRHPAHATGCTTGCTNGCTTDCTATTTAAGMIAAETIGTAGRRRTSLVRPRGMLGNRDGPINNADWRDDTTADGNNGDELGRPHNLRLASAASPPPRVPLFAASSPRCLDYAERAKDDGEVPETPNPDDDKTANPDDDTRGQGWRSNDYSNNRGRKNRRGYTGGLVESEGGGGAGCSSVQHQSNGRGGVMRCGVAVGRLARRQLRVARGHVKTTTSQPKEELSPARDRQGARVLFRDRGSRPMQSDDDGNATTTRTTRDVGGTSHSSDIFEGFRFMH